MKEWNKDSIHDLLIMNEKALYRAILKIYERQTDDEQWAQETHHRNDIGFNGVDAHILSSFAEQLKKRGFLSPKQKKIAMKKMPKYWKQILQLIQEKQEAQVNGESGDMHS